MEDELGRLTGQGTEVTGEEVRSTFVVGHDCEEKGLESWIHSLYSESNLNIDNLRLLVGAKIVESMRAEIFKQTEFRCSAGIAHNKMLAKLVCGINKSNKQTILPHENVPQLFTSVPIGKLRGLGGKLGNEVSTQLECEYVGDLAKLTLNEIRKSYDDKTSHWLYNISRGFDDDDVKDRDLPKSIGCGKNFRGPEMLDSKEKVEFWMGQLCEELTIRLNKDQESNKRIARGLTVSVSQERVGHRTLSGPLTSYETAKIVRQALELISKLNQSKDKMLWKPKLQNLSISSSKFEEFASSGKTNSVANFFECLKDEEIKSASGSESSFTKIYDSDCKASAPNDTGVPTTLAKEIFPSLWSSSPSLDEYDASLLENLPSKLKMEVKARVQLLEKELCAKENKSQGKISFTNGTLENNSAQATAYGVIQNEPKNIIESQLISTKNENKQNPIGEEMEQCPKCSAMVSPFYLPEHLDLHLAKEIHKEIQQDLIRQGVTSRIKDNQHDIDSKKRKSLTNNSQRNRNSKKQANITSFLVKK